MNHAKPSLVRFSLRTLLVLMMLLCIALATTVSASPQVELVMKWVAALAPAVAILLAAATSGSRRAFWIGFAAFALWLQLQLGGTSNGGDYLQSRFASAFRKQFRDDFAELRPDRIEDERMSILRSRFQNIFHANPDITPEEIQIRYSSDYRLATSWAREFAVKRSGAIAWLWLRLAASIVGGIAVAIVYAPRSHAK